MRPSDFEKSRIGIAGFVYNFGLAGSLRRRVGSAFIMRKGLSLLLQEHSGEILATQKPFLFV
ncbi:MAG: hypothetical protein FVQ84_15190 [Planctomycetes bacterium]|nr:hypothetical protein [Planctomycetota bacterium]